MEDQLVKKLKDLKSIKPEDGFVNRSRQLILSSQQHPARFGLSLFENLKLATALVLASALAFLTLGGISYMQFKNSQSLMAKNQSKDANHPGFQIQLGQAKYNLGKDSGLGAKIDELLKNLSL